MAVDVSSVVAAVGDAGVAVAAVGAAVVLCVVAYRTWDYLSAAFLQWQFNSGRGSSDWDAD